MPDYLRRARDRNRRLDEGYARLRAARGAPPRPEPDRHDEDLADLDREVSPDGD